MTAQPPTSFAAAATIVAQRVQQATGITITAEPDLLGRSSGLCAAVYSAG